MAKAKSNSVITTDITEGKLTLTVLGAGVITFDPEKASRECNAYAALHGWKQRLADAAAMDRDEDTGAPASVSDKYNAVKDLAEYYMSGAVDWKRTGKGGGGKSITIAAIARVKGIGYAEAETYVDAYAARNYEGDRAECLAFLRTGARVMQAMSDIRAERAGKPKVDADNALEDLKAE